jgi:hypothetical protein
VHWRVIRDDQSSRYNVMIAPVGKEAPQTSVVWNTPLTAPTELVLFGETFLKVDPQEVGMSPTHSLAAVRRTW